VGITEWEARKKGLEIKVSTIAMKNAGRAVETGNTNGLMKAVVDAKDGKILGVAVLGEEGGEVMSILQMAMAGNLTYKDLGYMIFAHPIYAEAINNLFTKMDN
jgi:pyruvate/2-oxoglutarate dehydrogenase complex dihydrolipoamide dehydrogenase (E3) component